jgi:hypothetical protein
MLVRAMTHQVTHQGTPTTFQEDPGTHRFVPMAEAVQILGLSATTIRRKIASGELEAERITRPQGEAWLIRVAGDLPLATADPPGAHHEPPGTLQESPGASHHAPPSTDVLTVVVVPLLAEVAASRQTIERLGETIRDQAETIGRQSAELEAARVQIQALTAPAAVESPDPTREPWWRAWAPWLLAVTAIVVVVVLLAWRW